MTATCDLCGQVTEGLAEVLDHLRLAHPDMYGDGPMRWPDGGLVVVDSTLEPKEFEE